VKRAKPGRSAHNRARGRYSLTPRQRIGEQAAEPIATGDRSCRSGAAIVSRSSACLIKIKQETKRRSVAVSISIGRSNEQELSAQFAAA
jgi:hypothetical protein